MSAVAVVLTVLGAITTLNAVIVTIASHWHAGVIFTYVFGIMLLCCGLFADHLGKAGGIVRVTALLLTAAVFVCVTALYVGGITDTVTKKEDAVIVLGAGLIGDRPSRTLADRLDAAVAYHAENPTALIVVSGGQGADEAVSEAFAMKRYLTEHGVAESVVVTEDRSTSTAENFAFSKELLDGLFNENYTVAYITSDFHVFRAGHIAKEAGLKNACHLHSATAWYAVVPNGLREMAAVVKTWLFD